MSRFFQSLIARSTGLTNVSDVVQGRDVPAALPTSDSQQLSEDSASTWSPQKLLFTHETDSRTEPMQRTANANELIATNNALVEPTRSGTNQTTTPSEKRGQPVRLSAHDTMIKQTESENKSTHVPKEQSALELRKASLSKSMLMHSQRAISRDIAPDGSTSTGQEKLSAIPPLEARILPREENHKDHPRKTLHPIVRGPFTFPFSTQTGKEMNANNSVGTADSTTTIKVTIGRIDVRSEKPTAGRNQTTKNADSFDNFLRRGKTR